MDKKKDMTNVLSKSASALVIFVAVLHFGFLTLEMFFWDHPVGRKIFGMTPDVSASSAPLAMQQGLYNGFLAVGLLWALSRRKVDVVIFFLLCVIVAGVFAAMTVKISIIFTQSLPALIALMLVWNAKDKS